MNNTKLSETDIIKALKLDSNSQECQNLIGESEQQSRQNFQHRGYVFAQIGLNCEPCTINCQFCSLAKDNFSFDTEQKKKKQEVIESVKELNLQKISDLFLMCTADYPFEEVLELAKDLRKIIPQNMRLVANVGDFSPEQAQSLMEAGFTGFYHIVRLGEGKDTDATVVTREKTIKNGCDVGLEIYYCIEPVGPEHSAEEICHEILRAQDLEPQVMAVMKRIALPDTPFYEKGEISDQDLAKIVAVTNLAVQPSRAMNVHEPNHVAMHAGVNQLYAEIGTNPRDLINETEKNRGLSIDKAWESLKDFDYYC